MVARSPANSRSLGIYGPAGPQIGLVRVITGSAAFACFCDVDILELHCGRGLAKAALALLATPGPTPLPQASSPPTSH